MSDPTCCATFSPLIVESSPVLPRRIEWDPYDYAAADFHPYAKCPGYDCPELSGSDVPDEDGDVGGAVETPDEIDIREEAVRAFSRAFARPGVRSRILRWDARYRVFGERPSKALALTMTDRSDPPRTVRHEMHLWNLMPSDSRGVLLDHAIAQMLRVLLREGRS